MLTKRFHIDPREGGFIAILSALLVCAPATAQTTVDLNLSGEDVRLIGGAGEGTGERVATGDFDGDGYADIAISAPLASPGGRSGAGKVYVKRGGTGLASSITLSSAAEMTVLGRVAGDGIGNWLASGDINHDSYDDLIIGAKAADPSTGTDAGEVYVIFGAATLTTTVDLSSTSADVEVKGPSDTDLVGAAVASGDLDGDGVADLIFSATDTSPLTRTKAGTVYVFYGNSTGGLPTAIDLSSESADLEIYGGYANDYIGASLATGDMNNDGFDDLYIGSTTAPEGQFTGEAFVILGRDRVSFGSTLDMAANTDLTVIGQNLFDFLAWIVSSGDVNRDGFDDLLIGAPNATGNSAGSGIGYVVYGGSTVSGTITLDDTSADISVLGAAGGIYLGWNMKAINLDGDGFGDIVISAPFASTPGGVAGEVYSYSGTPTQIDTIDMATDIPNLTVQGDDTSDQLGTGIAGGDINGDGVDDLIIGATQASEAYIIYGTSPQVELSLPNTSSLYDLIVTLPVAIDATTGMMMIESEMHFAFDTDLLTFSAANTGTLTSAWTLGTTVAPGSSSTVDTVIITGTNLGAPLTSTGEFINLDFLVKNSGVAITSPVSFEYVAFNKGSPDWNATTDGSVKLLGHDGLLVATLLSAPADIVRVRVTDPDLNLDSGNIGTHPVTLQNSVTGELETLVLTEQSVDDDVFFGGISTVFGTAGTNGDGVLNTQPGDELHVTYNDAFNSLGVANTTMATNQVVVFGDADGSGSLQAYDCALILSHAAQHLPLTGLALLVANLDLDAPESDVTAFDAALGIQRRLGMISRFPVQESTSKNHPQPETANNAKPVVEERYLIFAAFDDYISVRADQRDAILAADLVLKGIEGQIEMAPEMERFEMVYVNAEDGLHVAFAGPQSIAGAGELFRIYPTSASAQVRELSGHFNGGRIAAYLADRRPQAALPLQLALHPNMPNPFNAETLIRFELPAAQTASLEVFNALGQKVRTLVHGRIAAGSHQLRWDSRDDRGQVMATGAYFYRLSAGNRVQTQRMLLVK